MRRPIRWWRDNDRNTEICPLFLQPVTVMRDESPLTNTALFQGPALTTIYLFSWVVLGIKKMSPKLY